MMDKQLQQLESLNRAKNGDSLANIPAIISGFSKKGINPNEIIPRENVFTYNAWKALNLEKHGYPTWWEYCVSEWGTKWDVGHQSEHDDIAEINGGQFFVSFDSAWSPPTNAYEKLKNMGYVIEAFYAETGCDFCGKWDDGTDYCYRISKGDIPDDIVECMGLELQE